MKKLGFSLRNNFTVSGVIDFLVKVLVVSPEGGEGVIAQVSKIDCPVFFQSAKKASSPASVSGCL